jgi:hypothetical protein
MDGAVYLRRRLYVGTGIAEVTAAAIPNWQGYRSYGEWVPGNVWTGHQRSANTTLMRPKTAVHLAHGRVSQYSAGSHVNLLDPYGPHPAKRSPSLAVTPSARHSTVAPPPSYPLFTYRCIFWPTRWSKLAAVPQILQILRGIANAFKQARLGGLRGRRGLARTAVFDCMRRLRANAHLKQIIPNLLLRMGWSCTTPTLVRQRCRIQARTRPAMHFGGSVVPQRNPHSMQPSLSSGDATRRGLSNRQLQAAAANHEHQPSSGAGGHKPRAQPLNIIDERKSELAARIFSHSRNAPVLLRTKRH